MRAPPWRVLLLPLLSGVALWLAFPGFSWFPLAWVALVPHLHFLLGKPSWSRLLTGHLLMSGVYFGGVLYWIPRVLVIYGRLNVVLALLAWLMLLLVMSAFLLPFSVVTRWVASRSARGALLCAPGLWMGTELARNYYPANGFPWAILGYTQYPYSWIVQVADLGGVYLVSLLLLASNCALAAALHRHSLKPVLLFLPFWMMANLYGIHSESIWDHVPGSSIRVALVQPDIRLEGDQEHYAERYFEALPGYYRRAVEQGVRWVIFPEAPNPFLYGHDFYFTTFWERQVAAQGIPLLFNSTTLNPQAPRHYYNSALLLDERGQPSYRYHKVHLVPFGEYVPLEEWLGLIFDPVVQEVAAYTPGDFVGTGQIAGVPFATLICYEGIFPELSRQLVRQGAHLLVNITNDSWYGRTAAPRQHLEMSAFRAIESRRPLLRCANSGYSAIIDSRGRVTRQLRLFEEGLLVEEVAGQTARSPYSYVGEWINMMIVVTAGLAAAVFRLRRTPGTPGRRKSRQKK